MFKKAFVMCVVCIFFLGCATLFKGGFDEVQFGSDPQRADVIVNGVIMGQTPLTLELESNKTYTIEFRKEGYELHVQKITNHIGAGWIILDILGGLIPVIVDAATGDWYSLNQKNVNAVLHKQNGEPKDLPKEAKIAIEPKIDKVAKEVKKDVIETAEKIDERIIEFKKKVEVIIDRSKVRLAPNWDAQVIGKVRFGTFLDAKGKTRDGEWYIVELPSAQEGIVISGYIYRTSVREK